MLALFRTGQSSLDAEESHILIHGRAEGMDIRSLIQFLQVAKDKSYTKAAANLYLVQPTLSKTIQNMESELGVKLFQKAGQQIELTDYGERLIKIATPIVNQFQQIPIWILEDDEKNEGEIRISTTPLIGELYMASLVAAFCARYPQIHFRITEGSTDATRDSVLHCSCDVGFCMLNKEIYRNEGLDIFPLFEKTVVAAVHADDELAKRDRITMRDLYGKKINTYASGHVMNTEIVRRCKNEGFQPEVGTSSSNMIFLLKLSAMGNGVTLLPLACVKPEEWPDLRFLPFDPVFPWVCGIITKSDRFQPHIVSLFIRFVQQKNFFK